MSTFEQVAQMLADYKSIDVATITPDTTFASIGVDSLDMAELAMNMEEGALNPDVVPLEAGRDGRDPGGQRGHEDRGLHRGGH